MSAATITEPVAEQTTAGGDKPVHLLCCYDDVSMCGEQLFGEETEDELECSLCALAMGGPCTAPDCPYRSRLWRLYARLRGWT